MKFIQKILTSSSALLLILSISTHAALITESFDVEVVSGPGTGTFGTIDVMFDDTSISGFGSEFLSDPDVDVTLDLFGQTFTNSDDIDFPGLPSVGFLDGAIISIDFWISEFDGDNLTDIIDPTIGEIAGYDVDGGTWLAETLGPAPIPEPNSSLLLLSLLFIAGMRVKQNLQRQLARP